MVAEVIPAPHAGAPSPLLTSCHSGMSPNTLERSSFVLTFEGSLLLVSSGAMHGCMELALVKAHPILRPTSQCRSAGLIAQLVRAYGQ